MAVAFALLVLAAGIALIYIGWKGIKIADFWQILLGKAKPA